MASEMRKRVKKSDDDGKDNSDTFEEKVRLKSSNVARPVYHERKDEVLPSRAIPHSADKNTYEISNGTYWLTRVLFLRYLAFIYCKCHGNSYQATSEVEPE